MVETHLIEIEEKYTQVSKKTSELYELCEGLMLEERQLRLFGEELRECLQHWETLESCSHQLHSPAMTAEDEHFLPILKRVEDGIAFFDSRPKIRDGETYRLKFKQLQNRALTLMRNYLVALFRQFDISPAPNALPAGASPQVTPAKPAPARSNSASNLAAPPTPRSIEEMERNLTVRNAQFRTLAERARPLCEHIARNASAREYAILLNDTGNAYFAMRRNALQSIVQGRIHELAMASDVFGLVRHGMLYLAQLSEQEFELLSCLYPTLLVPPEFALSADEGALISSSSVASMSSVVDFFANSSPMTQLKNLLETMFRSLDDRVRPTILRTQDLDFMCSLIDILQYETIDSLIEKRPLQLEAMRPIARRLMEDVRDRLIFMTGIYIRDEIADYVPKNSELDYPKVLEDAAEKEKTKLLSASSSASLDSLNKHSNSSDPVTSDALVAGQESSDEIALDDSGLEVAGEGWYPPLTKTLTLLAKLYVAVDSSTFGGIAQEAVMACVQALCQAAKALEQANRPLDSALFLLKYVSSLKTNIMAFDVDLHVHETTVDFGAAREVWRRLLKGELSLSSLFSFSTARNPILSLIIASATPTLTHSAKDLRHSMQELITQTTHSFLFAATPASTHQILTYLSQSKAYLQSKSATAQKAIANGTPSSAQPIAPSDLATQPFATIEQLKQVCEQGNSTVRLIAPQIVKKLQLYLGHSNHAELIFGSFKNNLLDTFDNFRAFIASHYPASELVGSPIIGTEELSAILDAAFSS